jgi:Tfp pilus assembly protein PilO
VNRDRLYALAIGGGIVVVLVLGWVIGVSPVLAQAASADAQRSSIAASNLASQASIGVLKTKFARIDALTHELSALSTSVPSDAAIPVFLRELDALSNENSVGLSNVVVNEAVNYVVPAATPAPGAAGAAPAASPSPSPSASAGAAPAAPAVPAGAAGRLVLIPVKITVTGTYGDIMAFVGGLQSGERLYLISTLSVTGTVEQPAAYSGDLTGYVYALPLPKGVVSLADSVTPATAPSASPTPSASPSTKSSAKPSTTPTPTPTTKP